MSVSIRKMYLTIACGRVGKRVVLPVSVLCHCFDDEKVIDTAYLDDERGQRWFSPIILVMLIGTVL
jgi:hypothetical protein